jgi:5-(carboxyamino)imidazole ribonucleotide mutase
MGSDSDYPTMEACLEVLEGLGIPFEVKVTSAHRTPAETHFYVTDAVDRGCAVFIAAAGMAAHLAGVVASLSVRPVIGVPMGGGALDGLDALLSTVQMPGGVPVATVAIGKAGARNAAHLAAQIMAITDTDLATRLSEQRESNAAGIVEKDEAIRKDRANRFSMLRNG